MITDEGRINNKVHSYCLLLSVSNGKQLGLRVITEEERIKDIAFAYCRRVLTERMKNIAFAYCRRVLPDVKCIKAVSYNGT